MHIEAKIYHSIFKTCFLFFLFSIFLIFQSLQNLKVSKLFKLSWEIAEEIRNLGFEKDYDLIVLLSALPHAAGQCVGINSDKSSFNTIPTYVFSRHISYILLN